ncbi:hypothetical protein Ccar_14505 [Clostridium carboxidivorans P7]|uniref:Thymidylate synthase n=1 Tax=Clostridium carboxidivorans P7 TaxID=536227 RepID=C6PYQ7_9CLOT|nr:DUF166 family protein [Clostridium carboxidivorans]AKN32008.1 hypothetical protein Ccar_14505 [Clostridium carboxidivorans P7]EET85638.1 Protein of unknown function DUF166 [Clostridium carboxidivorans P7]EFG87854.1 hypothetical protein CLCAR_2455 [Clostridium carboxidivorans P7]
MKLLIICSEKSGKLPENEFYIKTDSRFANSKFIPNLIDEKEVCTVCGKKCVWCREKYNLNFEDSISQIIKLPDVYRMFEDEPLTYLPDKFKDHDIAVIIGVHQDILAEIPNILKKSGGKGLIVPCESGDWVSRWTREFVINQCEELGLEYAFPKPFCTLNKGKFETINKFIDEFRLGKPKFKLHVNKDNIIVKAEVIISAPCGNGYNIAKHLVGKKLGEEAKKTVAKFWHSYPCMGGMHVDPEIGDTPLHIGGYAHYSALENAEICKV